MMRSLLMALVPLALGGDYTPTGYVVTSGNIRTAVAAWLSERLSDTAGFLLPPPILPTPPASPPLSRPL